MANGDTMRIQCWIQRLRTGDQSGMDELLTHFERRLVGLTRKMLGRYPCVQRWEQTDDVFQLASLRVRRAILDVCPRNTQEFFGLAALQIRRELLNMAKVYRRWDSPSELGKNGPINPNGHENGQCDRQADAAEGPSQIAEWTEFHRLAGALPTPEREVFDLLWYHGLTQEKAAEVLGVSPRTVRGRWHDARLALHRALNGRLPGL